MIYFSLPLQRLVMKKVVETVVNNGYLVLGESESLPGDVKNCFIDIDSKNNIYQKRK